MIKGSYHDPMWAEKVTIPVKRQGDRWEFVYGGDVPVRDGTLGELTLCAQQLTDDRFRQRLTQELTVRILQEGVELRVALSSEHPPPPELAGCRGPFPSRVPAGTTLFVPIWIGPLKNFQKALSKEESGGLWLKLKGLETSELVSSTVKLPAGCSVKEARSLNHAFTVLSERFETHRISHTGNVYTRIFYQEPDGHWHPLDDLRQGAQMKAERQLLASTWDEIEQALGWRPITVHRRRSKA